MAKEYTKVFRGDNYEYDIYAFEIMTGGITPVIQIINKFIGKVLKS